MAGDPPEAAPSAEAAEATTSETPSVHAVQVLQAIAAAAKTPEDVALIRYALNYGQRTWNQFYDRVGQLLDANEEARLLAGGEPIPKQT